MLKHLKTLVLNSKGKKKKYESEEGKRETYNSDLLIFLWNGTQFEVKYFYDKCEVQL